MRTRLHVVVLVSWHPAASELLCCAQECYSDQADEYGDAFVFDVSDSASSHPSPSQRGQSSLRKSALQGALAGRPAEVERCDSPDSECALSGAGSLCDLQFILDEEKVSPAACLSLGSQGLPSSGGKIPRNKSLNGESDSWSLAAFSVSSLSVNSKPVLTVSLVADSFYCFVPPGVAFLYC